MSKPTIEKPISRKAQVLRYMRHKSAMSLKQAARIAGVTSPAIVHMEAGRLGISESRFETLAQAYGFTPEAVHELLDSEATPVSHRDECVLLIGELDDSKLQAVHTILVHLAKS